MINLTTGLPGGGKTLHTLALVKSISEKENRPVFYSGIADLKLPWEEIDPEKWFECPKNSIVVIDECQRVFRPRTISKEVPKHVSMLETHRHLGIDIYLITQHPMLADSAIRRLVGKHLHVVRTFGTERATVHEWASVKDTCDKSAGRADSIKHHWKYPKEVFDYYKSAEVHTVKRNIPMRFYILMAIPVLLALAVFYMWNFSEKQKKGIQVENSSAVKSSMPSAQVSGNSNSKVSYKTALEDSKQYVFEQTARVEGLPQTAPKYDEITKPTLAPVPVGCLASKTKCSCYSQQATPISMPENLCRDIVKNGYFQDFDVRGKQKEQERPQVVKAPEPVAVPNQNSGVLKIEVASAAPVSQPAPEVVYPFRPNIQNRPKL